MRMLMVLEFDFPEDADPDIVPKLVKTVSSVELPHLVHARLAIDDLVPPVLDLIDTWDDR